MKSRWAVYLKCVHFSMCAMLELNVISKVLRRLRPPGVDTINISENLPIPGGPTPTWRCAEADEDSRSNVPKSPSSHPFCGCSWSSPHPLFLARWVHAQLCHTLWDPMDCSMTGSSVHGILQARTLEWVAIPFSNPSLLHCTQILYLSHQRIFGCIWLALSLSHLILTHSFHSIAV